MANIQELSLEDQLFDARSRIQVLIANLESNERVHQHDVQELRARRDTSIAVLKAQLQAKDDALREKELEMKAMGKELRETKARDSEEMRVAEAKRRVDQDERRQLEEGRGKLDNDRRRLDEQKKTLDEARALLDARQRQFDETKETQRRLTRETEDRLKELTQQLELSKQNRALEMSTVDRAVQANEHAVKQETGLPLLATASAALTVVSSRVLFDSDDSKENLSSYQGHNITRGHSHIEAFGSQSRPVPHLRATVAHAPRNLSTAASVEVIELSSDEESMHDDPCPGAADPSSHGERSPRREVTPEGKGTVRGTMPPTPQTQPKAKLEQSALGSSSRDQLPGSGTPYLGSAPSINKAENLNKIHGPLSTDLPRSKAEGKRRASVSDEILTASSDSAIPVAKRRKVDVGITSTPMHASAVPPGTSSMPSSSSHSTSSAYSPPVPPVTARIPPTLNARIASIPSIPIPASSHLPSSMYPMAGYVKRAVIAKTYRCSGQTFIAPLKIQYPGSESVRTHSALFPDRDVNPGIPFTPGTPGTVLANRFDIIESEPISVFVRNNSPSDPWWLYIGEYELSVCEEPLTTKEFRALSARTREEWAKAILHVWKDWDCYVHMRVRIAFRKYGTEVTDETLAEAAQLLRQARKAKAPEPEGLQLTRADVLEAMDRGDEILNIILLKPVSFDMEFLEHTVTAQIRPTKHRPSTSNPKIKKPSTHKVYDDVQSASNSGLPKSLRRSARRSNALTSYAESASEEEDCEAAQDNESDFIAEPSPGDL